MIKADNSFTQWFNKFTGVKIFSPPKFTENERINYVNQLFDAQKNPKNTLKNILLAHRNNTNEMVLRITDYHFLALHIHGYFSLCSPSLDDKSKYGKTAFCLIRDIIKSIDNANYNIDDAYYCITRIQDGFNNIPPLDMSSILKVLSDREKLLEEGNFNSMEYLVRCLPQLFDESAIRYIDLKNVFDPYMEDIIDMVCFHEIKLAEIEYKGALEVFGSIKDDHKSLSNYPTDMLLLNVNLPYTPYGFYGVHIIESSSNKYKVVLRNLPENHSRSITNAVEDVATVVKSKYLPHVPANSISWYEYYPKADEFDEERRRIVKFNRFSKNKYDLPEWKTIVDDYEIQWLKDIIAGRNVSSTLS